MILSMRLRNTIFISLVGHITLFSVFSFSFGYKIPRADFSNVAFLGPILRSDLIDSSSGNLNTTYKYSALPVRKGEISTLSKNPASIGTTENLYYLKPQITVAFLQDKKVLKNFPVAPPSIVERKKPVIMFYPLLPYQFNIYFKDRQTAHIELMFNIVSQADKNSILVKRKVSSGNLEADLLSMRYISRYLFMQQTNFSSNKWQTVKIDLSRRDSD